MLGRAVSSSTPTDFQPSSTIGFSEFPLMNCQAFVPGPTQGCPYCAVGMHRAVESAIGFLRRSTNAWWMLAFLTPADVRRSFKMPPDSSARDLSSCRSAIAAEPSLLNQTNYLHGGPLCSQTHAYGLLQTTGEPGRQGRLRRPTRADLNFTPLRCLRVSARCTCWSSTVGRRHSRALDVSPDLPRGCPAWTALARTA